LAPPLSLFVVQIHKSNLPVAIAYLIAARAAYTSGDHSFGLDAAFPSEKNESMKKLTRTSADLALSRTIWQNESRQVSAHIGKNSVKVDGAGGYYGHMFFGITKVS